jgi:uncharacterized protein (TIGR03437 family)
MWNDRRQLMRNRWHARWRWPRLGGVALLLLVGGWGANFWGELSLGEGVGWAQSRRAGRARVRERERIEELHRRRWQGSSALPAETEKGGEGGETPWRAVHRRYDQPREAHAFFLRKRLPMGETALQEEWYRQARRSIDRMARFSTLLDRGRSAPEGPVTAWREGPSPSEESEAEAWTWLGPGNIGGRTRALVIDPETPTVMYAAGVSGGVWKTVDAGQRWWPIGDQLATLTVGSMALDPRDPRHLYVGTGEGVAVFKEDTQGDFRGAGIYVTPDAGRTWRHLAATQGPDFYFVNDLVVSSRDSRRLYAATRTGVWRSRDQGESWEQILRPAGSRGGIVLGGCFDLELRQDQRDEILFAACGTFEQATVYRTLNADSGATWQAVLSEPGMGRTSLAVAPSEPETIYAVASSIEPGPFQLALHAVFRSTAGGAAGSWTAQVRNTSPGKLDVSILSVLPLAMATECGYGPRDNFGGQAWYDLAIAVDPLDALKVWVGGVDLFRSDDGGRHWGVAGPTYLGPTFRPGPLHPDQHLLVFHPSYNGTTQQELFVANDGGIYRTTNARGSVARSREAICRENGVGIRWQSLNHSYGVTQFYHGAVSPDGKTYLGGAQDHGTVRGGDEAGPNGWRTILGGDGGYAFFDAEDPQVLFASQTGFSLHKSTDGGQTFGSATQGIFDEGLFIVPVAIDPSDSRRLWTGGMRLWRSDNGAARWRGAGEAVLPSGPISALAIAPTDANRVLAGTADGAILRQTRALQATEETGWEGVRPRTGFVSSLVFDPEDSLRAYATYSTFGGDHVWRTEDGGRSWQPLDGVGGGRLPDLPVHSLATIPGDPLRLYLGTDLGVFVTLDGGRNWIVESSGFPGVITERLEVLILEGGTWLYAFTHGRGVWRVPLSTGGCSQRLSPATLHLEGEGQFERVVAVKTTSPRCSWGATSDEDWVTVEGGGVGDGEVRVTLRENDGVTTRVGTVTIAGKTLTVVQRPSPDRHSPVVKITFTFPTPWEPPPTSTLTLLGTVRDNREVVAIDWRTDRGGAGSGALNSFEGSWRISDIPLGPGANRITITARDAAGNVGYAFRTVTARPTSLLVTRVGRGDHGRDGEGIPALEARINRPVRLVFDSGGTLYWTDADGSRVRKLTPDGRIETVVGTGQPGFSGDGGPARAATLQFPIGLAIDDEGTLFVCDSGNQRIRRIDGRTGIITTVAGSGRMGDGGDGGPAIQASLNRPQSIALDREGNLYLADLGNHRIRRVRARDGIIETIAGQGIPGEAREGQRATGALLDYPTEVVVDPSGDLLIAEEGHHRIRRISIEDGRIWTLAGSGRRGEAQDGVVAIEASLLQPVGLLPDREGNLYFSDRGHHRLCHLDRRTGILTTVAGNGKEGYTGEGIDARASSLNFPTGLAFDPAGRLFIADRENRRIRMIKRVEDDPHPPMVRILTPTTLPIWTTTAGSSLTLRGVAEDDSGIVALRWSNDRGGEGILPGSPIWVIENLPLQEGRNRLEVTAWDGSGQSASAYLVVDWVTPQVMTTLAGRAWSGWGGQSGGWGGDGDHPEDLASLGSPSGIALDTAGHLYVAETTHHRLRRLSPTGELTPFAGTGQLGSSGDGGPARMATLNNPHGVAVDAAGFLYVADTGNHRIRRISPSGEMTTVAGCGIPGMGGDGGPAVEALLHYPYGIALDREGNLLIADGGNLRLRRVDRVSGMITTVAGSGRFGSEGDGGPALTAEFRFPFGVTVDRVGNIYVADIEDQRIRRIAPSGHIDAYAGTGESGARGDGGPARQAQFRYPSFLTTDGEGNLYIADFGNHRIRRVDRRSTRIETVVGTGTPGLGPDGRPPLETPLLFPNDVAVDPQGGILVADTGNQRVLRSLNPTREKRMEAVSAATFRRGPVAPGSLVCLFGQGLASLSLQASGSLLPNLLAGTRVEIRDARGTLHRARLLYVSPSQINLLLPEGTAPGTATFEVINDGGERLTGLLSVVGVAPGLFSAGANGRGAAAGRLFRHQVDGSVQSEPIAALDLTTGLPVPLPIAPPLPGEELILEVLGTGWQLTGPLDPLQATISGVPVELLSTGSLADLPGLDQIRLRLSSELFGRGLRNLLLSFDGIVSNLVEVDLR